jgi:hypothetical protein
MSNAAEHAPPRPPRCEVINQPYGGTCDAFATWAAVFWCGCFHTRERRVCDGHLDGWVSCAECLEYGNHQCRMVPGLLEKIG